MHLIHRSRWSLYLIGFGASVTTLPNRNKVGLSAKIINLYGAILLNPLLLELLRSHYIEVQLITSILKFLHQIEVIITPNTPIVDLTSLGSNLVSQIPFLLHELLYLRPHSHSLLLRLREDHRNLRSIFGSQ